MSKLPLSIICSVGIWAYQAAAAPVFIQKISIAPQEDVKTGRYSLSLKFHIQGASLQQWQFGFYMPRSFRKTTQSNRSLTMRICDSVNNLCSSLFYAKTPFTTPDLSTVFTTIVAPAAPFPLLQGHSYTIQFQHIHSHSPENVSALPQNIFLVSNQRIMYLPTMLADYKISSLKESELIAKVKQRISTEWQNSTTANPIINIIPTPLNYALESGQYSIPSNLKIHDLSMEAVSQIQLWQQALKSDLQINSKIDQNPEDNGITLRTVSTGEIHNPEGYRLQINAQQIIIEASSGAGFFYALQSLRQLWFKQSTLPILIINDAPKFPYRGILLDVARHYFTLSELKNFIDIMAAAKLNTLHLHLSDDEAFRLNFPDYPELSSVGARRGYGLQNGPMAFVQNNLSRAVSGDKIASAATFYQGSYSKQDIQELTNYANLRQITIIPELDIPGHARALIKSLPDIFHEANDTSEYAGFGDDSIPVCAYASASKFGTKLTSTLSNLTYQTAMLFNQQNTSYAKDREISIGGDEVFKGTWDYAPSCQLSPWKNMDSLGKEHYFFELFNNNPHLNTLLFSGWHEFILNHDGKLNSELAIKPHKVAHVWVWGKSSDSLNKAITLANNNYPVVLAYSEYLYFDMTYTADFTEPGFYWASKNQDTYTTLSSARVADLTQQKSRNPQNILGLEGALWTDVIPSYSHLQYMALPKLAGLAEAAWSPRELSKEDNPNWQSLAQRLGCGRTGFLAYLNQRFAANYRGYPHGIMLEAPLVCEHN